jgi:hypothetical protein
MLNKFYRVAFRKEIYRTLEELQAGLDAWMEDYVSMDSYLSERRLELSALCDAGFCEYLVVRGIFLTDPPPILQTPL